MVCSSHSLRFRPFSRGFCTVSSDRYHVLLQFHCIFQYILMVSPATKKADLGGIDTPPSANCLVVHNPAKCSVFWRSTQGHGEISFPFGNPPPPPHPLFSLRSQTATSQLAGFRNNYTKSSLYSHIVSKYFLYYMKTYWLVSHEIRWTSIANNVDI